MTKEEKDLKRLTRWARKNGVRYVKIHGIEIDLRTEIPIATGPVVAPGKKDTEEETLESIPTTEDLSAKMPGDGDMLFYSSPSFDLITETRKEKDPR